jgi:hypothetical protein
VNIRDEPDLRSLLSAHTRQASEARSVVELNTGNIEAYAAAHRHTLVRRKLDLVLQYIAKESAYPGSQVMVAPDKDWPVFDAWSPEEVTFLISHVCEADYVRAVRHPLGGERYVLTAKGWEATEEPKASGGKPGRCFVAMSFADELDEAYFSGIRAAIEQDCGCSAVRLKEVQHNGDICDRILSEIRQAQFVVADFTEHKNGVYYEAGFARALGRDVINCCRADDFDDLHFDTNHLNHIRWATPVELRQKLADRIRATIPIMAGAQA